MRGNRFIDRTGERLGYITITKLSDNFYVHPTRGYKYLMWDYICDCGKTGSFNSRDYNRRKNAKLKTSCGCNYNGHRNFLLLNEVGYNKCCDCNKVKPILEFGVDNSKKRKICNRCKQCDINCTKISYVKLKSNPKKWRLFLNKQNARRDYKLEWERIKCDPFLKSKDSIRKLIYNSLKVRNIQKSKLCMKSEEILGCSFQEFKDHIESQFTNGMSWLNHGEWHLDHKVPLALTDNLDELIKLNHWTNFQPLSPCDNLSKGGVLLNEHLDLYKKLLG